MSPRAAWPWLRERLVYPSLQRLAGRAILTVCRTSTSGRRRVPRRGGVVIAFNHPSFLDAPLVTSAVPRPLYYLGKRRIYGPRPLSDFFTRFAGQLVIHENGDNTRALRDAIEIVEGGRALALAPEGTRSPDGRLRRGMTGVAMVAFATGAPIVPVGVVGTYDAWPRTRKLPRPFVRTRVVIGEPIRVERDEAALEDPKRCRELTDRVMLAIAELTGQPYDFPGVNASPNGRRTSDG